MIEITINGKPVPANQIEAGLAVMTGRFTRKQLADAVRNAGGEYARHLADKLIVRMKASGKIVRCDAGWWKAVEGGK